VRGRPRGNPNWGQPICLSTIPIVKSQFERLTARLGLHTLQEQLSNRQLREWVHKNYKHRYVPEVLIIRWNLASRFDLENAEL